MSAASPKVGKPPDNRGNDGGIKVITGWSGSEASNQRPSAGRGKISINRKDGSKDFGCHSMSDFRPSGHGPNGR